MSLETWKAEFYAMPAHDPHAIADDLAAVYHSLQKWRGLLPENLQRHGLVRRAFVLWDDEGRERFSVDANSCALCQRRQDYDTSAIDCGRGGGCPLLNVRDGLQCDQTEEDREECADVENLPLSPYAAFTSSREGGDPRPMLELLEKARQSLTKEKPRDP